MRLRTTLALLVGVLSLAPILAACGNNDDSMSMGEASSAPSQDSRAADVAFAQLMIQHHQQAVEMASIAQDNAESAQVIELAQEIRSAQAPEIEQMEAWLNEWNASEDMDDMSGSMDHDMGGMSGSGMMTAEQMAMLAEASGRRFDTMWLRMMIAHHEGAVTMAEEILTVTTDPAVETLANSILTSQSAEIEYMQSLLAD